LDTDFVSWQFKDKTTFKCIHFSVCSLVGGCSSDGLNDSYVENNSDNDKDAYGADDDTTLVKQSESVVVAAAAASGREQHLESQIADMQRYENIFHHVVVKHK